MQAAAYVVGTQRLRLIPPGVGGVLLQADSANTTDVYVGSESVTADAQGTGGIRLTPGLILPVWIAGDDPLWFVSASGNPVIRIMFGTGMTLDVDMT
jgi:hypothetical protein